MCWSGEASATLATIGFASTAYVTYKGEDKAVWLPLAYFSAMELLQAFTYLSFAMGKKKKGGKMVI